MSKYDIAYMDSKYLFVDTSRVLFRPAETTAVQNRKRIKNLKRLSLMQFSNQTSLSSGRSFMIILILVIIFYYNIGRAGSQETADVLPVSVSAESKPIIEVVTDVQRQTGYKVGLKNINESLSVTGKYVNISVEKLFTNLLKNHNIVIMTDKKNRYISVVSLNDKSQYGHKDNELKAWPSPEIDSEIVTTSPHDSFNNDFLIDPSTEKIKTIEMMHTQQVREFEQQRVNPIAIDPLIGLTNLAVENLHREQLQQYKNEK